MDIIGHLARTVTPAILGNDRTPQKESLLEQFYAIFAGRLADQDTYGRFGDRDILADDHDFYNQVWTDDTHRNSLSSELARENNVDESSVHSMLAAAAPMAFNEIKSLAGNVPVPQFLRDNLDTYRNRIPAWAGTLVPVGLLGTEPAAAHVEGRRISDTTSTAPLVKTEEEGGSFMKALLPIIGLIILGALAWALMKGCQDEPEAVVTEPVAEEQVVADEPAAVAADAEPASLMLSSGQSNELYACRVNAGDDALSGSIMDAIRGVFGAEADKCRADVDDYFAADMPAAANLAAILPLVKNTPDANIIIKGDDIRVNSPNDAELQQLVADIQAAAPDMNVVADGPLDLQGEIDNSLSMAGAAFDRLTGDEVDARDVARALSLQVINFEVDEAVIPDVNKPLLDRATKLLEKTPDAQLLIIGHTDAQASNAYNMDLSQRRAQAVKDYLISQGVDGSKLLTKGAGETDPIASNATEQGRFRNRRIEFTVYDESMGEADENGIIVAPNAEIMDADPNLNPLDANNDDVMPDGDDTLLTADPDLNPLDNNNDDVMPDGDDTILNADPNMNPLDADNDDIMPDQDDPTNTAN